MLVRLEERYKDLYTISDLERARSIIRQERDDEMIVAQYAEMAGNEILKNRNESLLNILNATATTAKNCRVWDAYEVGSEDMDIWIQAIAETSRGFIKFGAYLTDIWQIGATALDDYYVRFYTEYER